MYSVYYIVIWCTLYIIAQCTLYMYTISYNIMICKTIGYSPLSFHLPSPSINTPPYHTNRYCTINTRPLIPISSLYPQPSLPISHPLYPFPYYISPHDKPHLPTVPLPNSPSLPMSNYRWPSLISGLPFRYRCWRFSQIVIRLLINYSRLFSFPIVHWRIYSVQCTMYNVQCTVYNVYWIICNAHSIPYSVQ